MFEAINRLQATDEDPAVLILREARCLFAQVPPWLEFYRALLGTEGLIAATFTAEERAAFEHTLAFDEIQRMLAELRKARWEQRDYEPQRVLTIRVPKSLHESLRNEAHEKRTSMNVLAISKLLQAIDDALVPSEGRP